MATIHTTNLMTTRSGYSPHVRTLPTSDRTISRTSGLVCHVVAPTIVASILEAHDGYQHERVRKCELVKLRRGGTFVTIFFSGLLIALSDDSYGIFELLQAIWQFVEREEVL